MNRLPALGNGLPRLRRKVRRDLSGESGGKRQVVAAAVRMIDKAGFRIGNETYREYNQTRGVSTLDKKNVSVSETTNRISVRFSAKCGREVTRGFSDGLLNDVLQDCHELPGQRLSRYRNDRGKLVSIHSGHINGYLSEAFDDEEITAKDLRAWRATAAVVDFLQKIKTSLRPGSGDPRRDPICGRGDPEPRRDVPQALRAPRYPPSPS